MKQNRNERNERKHQSGNITDTNQQRNGGQQVQHRSSIVNNDTRNGNNNSQDDSNWLNYRDSSMSSIGEQNQQ